MKRCPTCDKTFADGMKFCQSDGTVLIEDTLAADPYKTVVGNQSDIASATPPIDPFKTVVGNSPTVAENASPAAEDFDSLKTMVVSQDELKESLPGDLPRLDAPPPPAKSAPLIEPKPASPKDASPFSPKPVESSSPRSADKTAVMDSNSAAPNAPSPFDAKPDANDFSPQSYGTQGNKPIPSPFDGSMIGYQPPVAPPFGLPKMPLDKEPEPKLEEYKEPISSTPFQEPVTSSPFDNPSGSSPFQPPTPFGTSDASNQPMQQSEWTPPPAPVSEWQNQDLGANTPFQPPGAASGQDQTLAIVSLVCGILGILCCGLVTGIPAIITGYMAKNNVDSNPNQYTGRGLAVAGMIMGGISVLFSILGIIYYAILIASASR